MRNVEVKRGKDGAKKNVLVITVDLDAEKELSDSGKSLVIGTTHGNIQVEGVTVGLTVYVKNPDYVKPPK